MWFLTLSDINRRFVKKTPIHKLLNTWAQSKNNDSRALVVTSTQRGTYEKRGTGKQDGIGDKHLFPAFVLNLICPLSEYDITFEASKTLVEFKVNHPTKTGVIAIYYLQLNHFEVICCSVHTQR